MHEFMPKDKTSSDPRNLKYNDSNSSSKWKEDKQNH